ncbi:MAG: NACHT domain-containing protein [Richelia sp. RM2_1_2]|nr:NACHT domain-containing protein [Richelia sp. RM1_1_1]NJO26372.1 NACHT domain-containing protein [Richelia sp. SL_2_1]NJO57620.1 NACHT domain-containing protein [Richelia sp. RM2_1_2]
MSDRKEHFPNVNQEANQTAVQNLQVQGNFTTGNISQYISQIIIEEPGDSSPKIIKIDWREVCSQVLKKQQLRQKATELGFELNVYVPLGLVERKQQQHRRASDAEGEKLYQLFNKAIAKEYQHDNFLKEVIGSNSTNNKHIAIVGEAGSGKTTLLTKIADWINKNEKGLPIYISLANLKKKSLENYLLKDWLEEALNFIDSEARVYRNAVKESLKERFRTGGVWLLLDGLDEMTVSSSTNALATIQSQLSGWVAHARVALTSRLNLWDLRLNNPLANFDTYRTLDFSQVQVEQFIKEWFAIANNQLIGTQLRAKLEETQYQLLRELVKNPLLLGLLCQIWYNNQGSLPQTRAGLYQRFAGDFYGEWKSKLHSITYNKQQELNLNKALGKLALAGINSQTRFWLGEEAVKVMGEKLFKSACDCGWLKLVYRDTDTNAPVYAFFQSSFQEYFAATAIDDWDFFLPRNHENRPVANKPYRIFEPQCKEVILLWLGREDVHKNNKNQFIRAITEFEDGCTPLFFKFFGRKGFYEYRANFLAAVGIAEYKDCDSVEQIVEQIIKWNFLDDLDDDLIYNLSEQLNPFCGWQTREQGARTALQEMGRLEEIKKLLINKLVLFLNSIEDEYICLRLAEGLGEIAIGDSNAIAVLEQMLASSENKYNRLDLAYYLGKVEPNNSKAISTLLQLLEPTGDELDLNLFRIAIISRFGEIAISNPKTIAVLEKIIKDTEQKLIKHTHNSLLKKIGLGEEGDTSQQEVFLEAIISLIKIDPQNRIALLALGNYICLPVKVFQWGWRELELLKTESARQTAISRLEQMLDSAKDENTRFEVAYKLGKIEPNNSTAISTLVQLLKSSTDKPLFKKATYSLAEIGYSNPKTIALLEQMLDSVKDETRHILAVAECLGKINPGNSKAIAALKQLLDSAKDKNTVFEVAYNLGKIDPGNSKAISRLVELLESTKDEFLFENLTCSLAEIGSDNPIAIAALEKVLKLPKNLLLRSIKNEYDREDEMFEDDCNSKLNNFLPVKLAEIIAMFRTNLDSDRIQSVKYQYFEMRWQAACALATIDPGNKTATKVLLSSIKPFIAAREDGCIVEEPFMGIGNQTAISLSIQLIKSTNNPEILGDAAETLIKSLNQDSFKEIVSALKAPINRFWRFHAGYQVVTCYNLIWYCAQNMSYNAFYKAWQD